ncbi:transposase family protein [Streptomyces sp. NBC_00887]|uniref:helix-turn-helix domain-containing protein n=1 Tax=Streptomyces sp. NBC_00887 TaxID=2975859 RepID=UPI003862F5B7|nr:transposase family protein [Streptomyces sp. NBC_00887]
MPIWQRSWGFWQARRDAELELLDRPRRRAVGAGAKYKLVFVDRLLATQVRLRHGVTHDVLACWFQVDRSTITRAVGEIRPLLADRGCRIEGAGTDGRHRDQGPSPERTPRRTPPVDLRQEPHQRHESPRRH